MCRAPGLFHGAVGLSSGPNRHAAASGRFPCLRYPCWGERRRSSAKPRPPRIAKPPSAISKAEL